MLVQKIEEKRKLMITLAQKHGMASELTIRCSQELDNLLNILYKTENKYIA